MSYSVIVQTKASGVPVKVRASRELILGLQSHTSDVSPIYLDIQEQLEEYDYSDFSPDRTERRMESVQLFLYRFSTPDMPLVDPVQIEVNPINPLYNEGKIGWTNCISLYDGCYGNYDLLIENGFWFLK